jgi:hypothetical protein
MLRLENQIATLNVTAMSLFIASDVTKNVTCHKAHTLSSASNLDVCSDCYTWVNFKKWNSIMKDFQCGIHVEINIICRPGYFINNCHVEKLGMDI